MPLDLKMRQHEHIRKNADFPKNDYIYRKLQITKIHLSRASLFYLSTNETSSKQKTLIR